MPGLIGPDDVRKVADVALEVGGVDGVEVLFMHEWGALSRFADSAIHQSTSMENTGLRVRVVKENRVGIAASNEFTKEGARRVAESAKELAEVASPDPLFPGLAPREDVPRVDRFDETTAATSPEERAELIAALVGKCDRGFHAAGALETIAVEAAVANSEGQFCYTPYSQAMVNTVVSGGEGGAGYAESWAGRLADLDVEGTGAKAARKARDSQNPQDLDAGRYDVVLEPAAVATLVAFLAYLGFGGRSLLEERSCFSGKQGQQVAAPSISIYDDALSDGTLGLPFDFEGTPKRRVDLIKDGVFTGGVYDRRSAKQAGVESTGHALPPPNPEGPFPLNLMVQPGDASLDDMVKATERGLLVTRFHYSNVVHPKEAIITGMTRDGTFLIENGEVKHAVKNFRFTQSVLEALTRTTHVGRDTEMVSEFFFAASQVPGLATTAFNFTGRSDH